MRSLVLLVLFSCAAAYGTSDDEGLEGNKYRTVATSRNEDLNLCAFRSGNAVIKRSTRQDEMGPFWANRGKKTPMYSKSTLFVEEPHWTLVQRDDDENYEPFFTTRGKKLLRNYLESNRERRNHDKWYTDTVSPFLATRGKKTPY